MSSSLKGHQHFVTQRRITVDNPLDRMSPEEFMAMPFPVPTPGQSYAIISYVAQHTVPKTPGWTAMRIYCTCGSLEEAERICVTARSKGFQDVDLFIVKISDGFFPMPPPADASAAELVYDDAVLSRIMSKDQQRRSTASNRVQERADGPTDTTSVEKVFEECVTEVATALFEDWRAEGLVSVPDPSELARQYSAGMAKRITATASN